MTKISLKRLAIGLFILVAIAGSNLSSSASGETYIGKQLTLWGTDNIKEQPAAVREDCTFLNNTNFFGDPRKHMHEMSEATAFAASYLPQDISSSTSNIPRRNFIDQTIFAKMDRDHVQSAPLSTDEEFIRRVTLDLTGRIPTADQVRLFVRDNSTDKRDRLVDSLIGTPEFVDRWTMWLGDLLKNTAFSLNVSRYPDGRNAFYSTIKQAVEQNIPYNQFVNSLITSTGNSFQNGATNYIVGAITPMGPAQDTYDTMAVQASKELLGIETMDCLLCHDGAGHLNALNLWATNTTRVQAWGMSAFFARVGIKQNVVSKMPPIINEDVFDQGSGEYMLNTSSGNRKPREPINGQSVIMPKYLFTGETPQLGENRRVAFARLLTKDRQFARATVNYLWAHFFGMGIVDPPTGFDLARLDPNNPPLAPWTIQPTHPDLLEQLTDDFIANNYNLQHTMRLITESSAYQLSSRYPGEWKEDYVPYFARKFVRRLDAEELHDAVVRATGIPTNFQVYGLPGPLQWAMQLPDTVEPIPYQGTRLDGNAVVSRAFLDTFGRGNRDLVPRTNTPSILQGLSMMNSPFINSRIHVSNNGTVVKLLSADSTDHAFVQDLFLTVLSRKPTKKELKRSLAMLKTNRSQGAEDLMWVLVNKIDFLYNY